MHEEFKFTLKYQSLDIGIDIDWCQQENFYNFRLLSAEQFSTPAGWGGMGAAAEENVMFYNTDSDLGQYSTPPEF